MGAGFSSDTKLQAGLRQVILGAASRNKKRLSPDSTRYAKLYKTIIKAYMRVLIKLIVETVLGGDKLFLGNKLMSFHLFDMPPLFKGFKISYKYHHKINGAFPILRTSIHRNRLVMMGKARNTWHTAFMINSGITKKMSGMMTNKIINEKIRYSDDPHNTHIKEKKLNDGRKLHDHKGDLRRKASRDV